LTYLTLCHNYENSGISKNTGTSFWNFVPSSGFKIFVHDKQQNTSYMANKVVFISCLDALCSLLFYLFKHRRQRAEATYMPVKSVQ